MIFLRQVAAIIAKDVAAELRTKENLSAMLVFSLLVLVIFNFAFELKGVDMVTVGPGILWVAFTFSGILGLGRSFAAEKDKGSLDGILLAPVDRGAILVGKALANLIFIGIMEAITLPLFVVLFNVSLPWLPVTLYLLMGTIGFSVVGTLLSAVSASTRMREVMLPVLLFPVLVPLFIAAVKTTSGAMAGQAFSDYSSFFNLLLAFDVIFIVVAYLVFEYVVEE
ncbi:MAG: heme exporter protein CcmB [Anaerolineae bacterium]